MLGSPARHSKSPSIGCSAFSRMRLWKPLTGGHPCLKVLSLFECQHQASKGSEFGTFTISALGLGMLNRILCIHASPNPKWEALWSQVLQIVFTPLFYKGNCQVKTNSHKMSTDVLFTHPPQLLIQELTILHLESI